MKTLIVLLISLVIAGCASGQGGMFGPGRFEVVEADMRFSNTGNEVFTSRNNRISSKSIAGGVHIDGSGVFINPVLTRSSPGELLLLGFSIENMTSHDTTFGSPNRLGNIQRITFLIDGGDPIILSASSSSTDWSDVISYNTVTRSASSNIQESAMVSLSVDEYKRILGANEMAVQIQGSIRTAVYENSDISSSFIPNLREFHDAFITVE
ncbi:MULTISPECIES: hypothetical protein [unclassified Pseudoalteromonas]|uniref:hypothetical protein n=2 Tax=Pseudoalteromonas TaxID=53246 RepID=UPI00332FAEE6